MLDTVLDYSIFKDFTASQPEKIPVGTLEENKYWDSFWEFLKQGCNLTITNMMEEINNNEPTNIFLNSLTTGRKGTRFSSESKFKVPHKYKLPHNASPHTVYFLDEEQKDAKKKYRQKNGFLFGFKEDYPETWKSLSLQGKSKVLPVRKNAEDRFLHWEQLSDYITPFTDLIIVDNFMFVYKKKVDESIWDDNLFPIIRQFAEKTPVKFNLLLLSFAHDNQLNDFEDIGSKINEKLKTLKINCNLSVVLANDTVREHDRGIFTNYLRTTSGDSFNYFFKNRTYRTRGTEIAFWPVSVRDNFNAYQAALRHIAEVIASLQTHPQASLRLYGNLKNYLLPDQ